MDKGPTKKDQMVSNVHFIFEECARFLKAFENRGFKDIDRNDALFSIPHPSGQGSMICGRQAYRRLDGLAAQAAQHSGIAGRVNVETVRRPLAQILVDRFINEKRDVNSAQVESALSAAARWAKRKCADRTYLVPCHLMWLQEPYELRIGPVLFKSRRSFRKLMMQKIKEQYDRKAAHEKDKWSRTLMSDCLRYYRSFGWVAEVQIQNCDEETSGELARRAVASALDCLHLVLGQRATYEMRIGGPRLTRDRRAVLTMTIAGVVMPRISIGGPGQVGFREGWSDVLEREDFKRMFTLCGVALEAAVNPDLIRPLSRRFLDAALWFGQAVREESPAASAVKYVTAIERILMTEEKDDISRIVSDRLSAVCAYAYEGQQGGRDRADWYSDVRLAYGLRSKLVHGSMSPSSEEVYRGVSLGAKLCEAALLAVLVPWAERGLRDDTVTSRRLAEWFGRVIAAAPPLTAPMSQLP
jgi:hypothetical protein